MHVQWQERPQQTQLRRNKIRTFVERLSDLHTDDAVIRVAGDMEPGAGVDQSRIPALENVGWIF
jgi:hypothetical protein